MVGPLPAVVMRLADSATGEQDAGVSPSFRAVFLAALAAAILTGGCSGDNSPKSGGPIPGAGAVTQEPAGGTPPVAGSVTSGPTVAFPDCPAQDRSLCAMTATLEGALVKGDGAVVVALLVPQTVECSGKPAEGIDPAATICEGKKAGEKAQGYAVGRRATDGGLVVADSVTFSVQSVAALQIPTAQDDYGFGRIRQMTVAAATRAGCATCHLVIYSYILSPISDRFVREVIEVEVAKEGVEWRATRLFSGILFAAEAKAFLVGGVLEGHNYQVWNQSDRLKPVSAGGIYLGQPTAVTKSIGDCLNVREAPTTAAKILICRPPAARLTVVGGPANADNIRWWRVDVLGVEPPVVGWVSAEFLER